MGKMSRNKGAQGEREFAHFLQSFGIPAYRTRQRMNAPGAADVQIEGRNHAIEVKRRERMQVRKWLSEAEEGLGGVAVVAHRGNRQRWVVVQYAEDWAEMYRDAYGEEL